MLLHRHSLHHDRVARLGGAFIALALLAGCALGPDYKRPGGLAPASYRQPPAVAGKGPQAIASATPLGEMPWWDVFKDPQLQKLIRQALANNQDLKIAIARVDQAHAALGSAQADQLPNISANGSATRLSQSDALWDPALGLKRYNSYAALLNLSYEVDLWGRVRRVKEAARDALLSTDAARRTVVSTLVTGVAQAYFTLLELDSETRITSDTLRTRQETLKLMELRRSHGVASDLEVSQFLAEVAATPDGTVGPVELRIEHGATGFVLEIVGSNLTIPSAALDGSLWLSSECREFGVMAKSFVYQNAYLQRWFRAARHPEDQQEQQRLHAYLSRRV